MTLHPLSQRLLWLFTAALYQSVCAAEAPLTPDRFAWQQPLALSTAGEALYRFELPAHVYAHSQRRDLGDLRFFNHGGEVVPHALLVDEGINPLRTQQQLASFFMVRQEATPPKANRKSLGPAGYVIDARALKGQRMALVLTWRPEPKGLVLPVQVETSEDLQVWRSLGTAQLVDLRSGTQRLLQDRIDLSGLSQAESQYLRLSWPASQGLWLTQALLETTEVPEGMSARLSGQGAQRQRWTEVAVTAAPSSPDGGGEFWFDTAGLPVTAMRLRLPQPNTVVQLSLFHRRGTNDIWQAASQTLVYRLTRQGQEVESEPIPLCCSADRYWRLVFDQRGGGIGQSAPGVSLQWRAQQGLLVARGQGPFVAAYGSATVPANGLSVKDLMPGYQAGSLPSWPLLPEAVFTGEPLAKPVATTPLSGAGQDKAEATWPWRTVALWAALVLGVLCLGAMVWQLLRQMPPAPARSED